MSSGSPPRKWLGEVAGTRRSPAKPSPSKRLRIGAPPQNRAFNEESLYPQPGVEVPTNETHTNVTKKGPWGIPAYASKLVFIKDKSTGKHTKTRKYVNYRLGHTNSVKKTKHEGAVYRELSKDPEFTKYFLPFVGANSGAEWAYVNFKMADTQDLIDVLNDMFTTNSVDGSYLRRIARQVFEGLEFLAKEGYIHGDIKVDNILVDGDRAFLIDLADTKKDPPARFIEKDVDDVKEMLIHGFRFPINEIEPLFKDPVDDMDALKGLYRGLVKHFDSKRGGRTRKNRR